MKVRVLANKPGLDKVCNDILRALLGQVEFILAEDIQNCFAENVLSLRLLSQIGEMITAEAVVEFDGMMGKTAVEEKVILPGEEENQLKRLVKLAAYQSVLRVLGREPLPWGILTGIRPTKIVHRLLDVHWEPYRIQQHLVEGYGLNREKASELTQVAMNNRRFILTPHQARKLISVYIGVPFCPTRCAYCSFPAYPLQKFSALVPDFLVALKKEITLVGKAIQEMGLKVQTVYIGGGTPTTLLEGQLGELLFTVNESFNGSELEEITLEAGRPDSITREKLRISKEAGVTRLSINPQSMNLRTLEVIGRRHSPEEVHRAFADAREEGFDNINMDLIVGLPGEKVSEVEYTLSQLGVMKPENITVHTMAVKRASQLKEEMERFEMPGEQEVHEMLEAVENFANDHCMNSYYLYRQKYMVGPLENKGYTVKGRDCIYNVQVIEERQTVLGLGAGAATKFVEPSNWTLTSHYNPKDPIVYIDRIEESIRKKIVRLKESLIKNIYS